MTRKQDSLALDELRNKKVRNLHVRVVYVLMRESDNGHSDSLISTADE